jgi:hypothetical protein
VGVWGVGVFCSVPPSPPPPPPPHDKDFSGALAALLSIVRQDFLDGLIKPHHGHKLLKYTKLEGHLLDARRNILKI